MRHPLPLAAVLLLVSCPSLRAEGGDSNSMFCQQHPEQCGMGNTGPGGPSTTVNSACVANPQLCMGTGSATGGGSTGGGTSGGGKTLIIHRPGGGGGTLTPQQTYCILHPELCGPGGNRTPAGSGGTPPPPDDGGGAAPGGGGGVQGRVVGGGGGYYGPAPAGAAESKTAGLMNQSAAELEEALKAAQKRQLQNEELPEGGASGPGGHEASSMADKKLDLAAMRQHEAKNRDAAMLAKSARSKTEMGDYLGGVQEATNAVNADPNNPEGYVRRAEALGMLGKYDAARSDAETATRLMPEYGLAWQNLAWADLKKGRLAEALKEIDKAIALNPDDPANYAIKAYILEQMGDAEGALKAMRKAARLDARFQAKADEGAAGRRMYNPDQTSALTGMLAEQKGGDGSAAPAPSSSLPLAMGVGAAAAVLLAGGGAAFWFLKRKKSPASTMSSLLSPAAIPAAAKGGTTVGKYELGRMLGRGGMGAVYEATDHALGRPVAVKKVTEELGSEAKAREMLFKEARTVASLHHPAIVEIYDIFEDGKDLYVVFELVKGRTISQILSERRRLSLQECLGIMRPVCEALEYAHARQMVHRDLKPANIMVNELGQVKLMDFGIARSVADAVPMTAAVTAAPMAAKTAFIIGTPAYMPPEAESGVVSQAGDVYALGVCLYEMALGQAPFPPSAGWDYKLQARFPKPSELDPSLACLDGLISQALEPDAKRRTASAGAFLTAFEAAVSPG